MKQEWDYLSSGDWTYNFIAKSTNFLPRTCCTNHKKQDKREPGLFEEDFRCTEMISLCSKTYCCSGSQSKRFEFSSKLLNKRTLEDCGDGPMSMFRKVLDDAVNTTSTKIGFRNTTCCCLI